ncbi:ribosomal protein L21e [Tanacetum coccineum]
MRMTAMKIIKWFTLWAEMGVGLRAELEAELDIVTICIRKFCKALEEDAFRSFLHHYDGYKVVLNSRSLRIQQKMNEVQPPTAAMITAITSKLFNRGSTTKNAATAANKEIDADSMLSNQFVKHQLHMPSLVTQDSPDLLESSSRDTTEPIATIGVAPQNEGVLDAKFEELRQLILGTPPSQSTHVDQILGDVNGGAPDSLSESHLVQQCNNRTARLRAETDHPGQRVGLPDQALGDVNGGLLIVYQDDTWSHRAATKMCADMVRPIAHFGSSSVHTEGVAPIHVDLGDYDQRCRHCGAMFWYEEHDSTRVGTSASNQRHFKDDEIMIREVDDEANKLLRSKVGNRIIKKRIHIRVEPVMPSRCTEEFKQSFKKNDQLKAEAKARGEVISSSVPKDSPWDPNMDSWLKALDAKTNGNDVTSMRSINSIYNLRELKRVSKSQTIFGDLHAQIGCTHDVDREGNPKPILAPFYSTYMNDGYGLMGMAANGYNETRSASSDKLSKLSIGSDHHEKDVTLS